MKFLKNLERLMRSNNINKSELARACDLSTSTVNSWWNRSCENISLQTLIKLSNYFNCTIEEIVHGVPSKSYIYTTNEFTTDELELIDFYAGYIKSSRRKAQNYECGNLSEKK